MKYKNTRTGIVVDSPFLVSGGNWIPLDEYVEEVEEVQEVAEEIEEEEETDNGMDDLTKQDIIQELESLGVDFNPRDTKEVLYNLMMEN